MKNKEITLKALQAFFFKSVKPFLHHKEVVLYHLEITFYWNLTIDQANGS
jgi:hypothetical protein